MADLSSGQIRKLEELALAKTTKVRISKVLHVARSTVYRKLDELYPRNGELGVLRTRTRSKGNYKADAQTMHRIRQHVLANRFCTNKDIIQALELQVKSIATISKWLKQMGIGTYVAATNQFLRAENIEKR